MSNRALRWAAVVLGSATIFLAVIGALMRLLGPAEPQTYNIGSPLDFIAEAASASTYAVIGLILAQRLPRHPVPWIFLVIGFCFAGVVVTWAYAVVAMSQTPELPLAAEGLLFNTAVLQPIGLGLLVCLLVLFPDGRPFDRLGRRVLWLVPVTASLVTVGVCLTPTDIGIFTGVPNPLQFDIPASVGRAFTIAGVALTVGLGVVACRSLLRRYRSAAAIEREQIRWFAWAGALALVLAGGVLVLIVVFPNILNTPAEAIVLVTYSVGAALIPLACAVAIRRYQLYDIDQLISQTFVYTCLVAIVAGVYTALITALQRVSVELTGAETDFSVVITTLVLAVVFEPMKRRLEAYAERFRDDVPPVAPSPSLDDAIIDAIADRVAEKLRR